MPTKFVDVTHKETGNTARVPEKALPHYRAKGFVPTVELESKKRSKRTETSEKEDDE